jgi:hypothetical protein
VGSGGAATAGAGLGEVASARAVSVDEDVLVAELLPGRQRIVFRGVDDEWRLVRFADGDDVSIRPETTRRVELHGWQVGWACRYRGIRCAHEGGTAVAGVGQRECR